MNSIYYPVLNFKRNLFIYYDIVLHELPLKEVSRKYKLSSWSVKKIILREARRRAPETYKSLKVFRFDYCGISGRGEDLKGPSIFELQKFKEFFLYGDIDK
jgi:hypothetical protein